MSLKVLSTGILCPKCGCQSLEKCFLIQSGSAAYDVHYHCVAGCGLLFGLKKLKSGKILIGYNSNENILKKRFNFIETPEFQDNF